MLQVGLAYNTRIVDAFRRESGDRLTVAPCFFISGAHGPALLALKHKKDLTRFHGFDRQPEAEVALSAEIQRNIAFSQRGPRLLLEGYDPTPVPGRKTVGVPFALMIHKFFPMANAFFSQVVVTVLLSPSTTEKNIIIFQQQD